MIALLTGAAVSMMVSILATPMAIRYFRNREIGQFIQEEVKGHHHKQGTPTMGGAVFVLATVMAYLAAHVQVWSAVTGFDLAIRPFSPGAALAVGVLVGMSVIGFLDDYVKHTNRRSLGLSIRAKYSGQVLIALGFAWGAREIGLSTELSLARPLGLDLGPLFVVLVLLMITGFANGANFADGMDGLAAGSGALMFGAFTIMSYWQSRNPEIYRLAEGVDAAELAVVAASMLGGLLGFLWWNAAPARIFMGDVGSNAIGALLAALALLTNTHLLLLLIAGFYVAESASSAIQIIWFRMTGRRVFRMAPIHHHFELLGWPETTVVVRLWIVAGIGVALGLGLFYSDFIGAGGISR